MQRPAVAMLGRHVVTLLARPASDLERDARGTDGAPEVKTIDRVYSAPQVRQRGLVVEVDHQALGRIELLGPPLRFGSSQPVKPTAPPVLGQHSAEIRGTMANAAAV